MGEKFSIETQRLFGLITDDVYQSEINKQEMTKEGDKLLLLGKYIINKKIGSGAFGIVYLCTVANSDIKVAIKAIDLMMAKQNNFSLKDIEDEVSCLRDIDSPQVIKLIETQQTKENQQIVTEFVDGTELLQLLIKHGSMGQNFAREVFKKILIGVSHMHKNQFIHRDMKLENVFVKFKSAEVNIKSISDVKIVDLGFGTKIWSSVSGFMGTPNQIPPEVFDHQPYDFKFDMFSCGVILYTMICGEFPFAGSNLKQISNAIKKKDPNYDHINIRKCTPELIELMKGLLHKDKNKRMTIDQALNSAWINQSTSESVELDTELKDKVLGKMTEYAAAGKVQKAIKIFKTKLSIDNNINSKYKDLFFKQDRDNNGSLSIDEFQLFMKDLNPNLTDFDIDRIFKLLDLNDDHSLEQKEFISVFDEAEEANDEMMLDYLFKFIDADGSGNITRKELRDFLKSNAIKFNNEEIDRIIREIDVNDDNDINLNEFKEALLKEYNKLIDPNEKK